MLAGERAGESRKVSGRRFGSLEGVAVPIGQVGEEPGERPDILVVVPRDLGQRHGRAPAQELVVAAGDLPALDVADTVEPEQGGLRGPQPSIGHPVTEQAADDGQQVEVAGMDRGRAAREPEPRREQRPVEPAAVVGDEPGGRRDRRLDRAQERSLLTVVGEQELDLPVPVVALPPAKAHQEGGRARGRRETGRLRVETDERHVRRWLAREHRQPFAVDGYRPGRVLAPDDPTLGARHHLAIDRRRESGRKIGRCAAVDPSVDRGRREDRGQRGTIAFEPPREGRGAVDHDRAVRRPPRSAPRAPSAAGEPGPARPPRARGAGPCRPGSPRHSRTMRSGPRRRPAARRGDPTSRSDSPIPPGTASYR